MFRSPLSPAVAILFAAVCLRGQTSNTPPYFTVTDLGVLPGMQSSTATGISSSGIISGYSSPAVSGAEGISGKGFLYANGTMTAIQKTGDTFTVPIAVNTSGTAVGLTGDYASRRLAPFVYQNGQFQIPASLPYDASGNSVTLLTGINDSGAILGNTVPAHSSGAAPQPFVYTDGTVSNLPLNFAAAIASNGDVAGTSLGFGFTPSERTATFWSNGKAVNVGAGEFECEPRTGCYLDAQGLAVTAGHAAGVDYPANTWIPESAIEFPTFPGGGISGIGSRPGLVGTGIANPNNNGQAWLAGMRSLESTSAGAAAGISGDLFTTANADVLTTLYAWPFSKYFAPGNSFGSYLAIFPAPMPNAPGVMLAPFSDLVVNGSGWQFDYIAGMNDAGLIVGTGTRNGQQRAFLLTPGAAAPAVPSLYYVQGGGLSVPQVTSITTGGWFSLFGFNFKPPSFQQALAGIGSQPIVNNVFPTNLAQTCVEVNGTRAALDFVGSSQINAQAPSLPPAATAQVTVVSNCGMPNEVKSNALTVPVASAAPEFLYFQDNNSGQNPVAATFGSGGPLVAFLGGSAAKAGDSITVYAVGLGATTPAQVPGAIATVIAPVNGSVRVSIGGVSAPVSYGGVSPGSSGLYQLNLTVPAGLASGNQPISMTVNGATSPVGAYLAIQ